MKRRSICLIAAGVLCVVVILIIVIVVKTKEIGIAGSSSSYYTSCGEPQDNKLETYPSAAISSDAHHCSHIAKDVLEKGGAAGDAAVAAMFCIGIINAQSSGLGGGFVATYYSKAEGKVYSLDAREVAPAAASEDMYMNPTLKGKWWEKKKSASYKGGLAVAVPGESAGLYELYTKFGGKIPWRDLIEPSIKLCEEGFELSWYHAGIMQLVAPDIRAEPSISDILLKKEGKLLQLGDVLKRPLLAMTLRALQDNPFELVNGSLAKKLAEDIKSFDGIVTEEDLANYRPRWREPIRVQLQNKGYTLHSFPPPGSGLIVGLILNILDNYNLTSGDLKSNNDSVLTYHRIVEAFKFSYARRSLLGDLPHAETEAVIKKLTDEALALSLRQRISDEATHNDMQYYDGEVLPQEDDGTAHLSLVAPDGDAVSITASINFAYGAGIRSMSTGIILNNQMADFTTDVANLKDPTNRNNIIVPGNRPLSSMSPSIILDSSGDVRLVIGGAGGTKIPSAIAWVTARNLWMGEDLKEASDSCRLHHQLDPMWIQHDKGFPKDLKDGLRAKGHEIKEMLWKSIIVAIARNPDGDLETTYDFRKSGQVAGL